MRFMKLTFFEVLIASIVALMVGSFTMILAGVNDCRSCTVGEALTDTMHPAGWIGVALVALVLVLNVIWIVLSVINLVNDRKKKKRIMWNFDEERMNKEYDEYCEEEAEQFRKDSDMTPRIKGPKL